MFAILRCGLKVVKSPKKTQSVFYSTSKKGHVQTINPTDRLCVKYPPTKLLVKRDSLKDPCGKQKLEYYQPPRATPIHVCKPQDLKRIVQPPPCKCPPKKPPLRPLQAIKNTVVFGMKLGIAGSIVYATVDNGLWGSSEETSCLYQKIICHMQLLLKKECEIEPEVPRVDVTSHSVVRAWNRGVTTVFALLYSVPYSALQCIKNFIGTDTATMDDRRPPVKDNPDDFSCKK